MKTKLLIVFLATSICSFGQVKKNDCPQNLKKIPYFMRYEITFETPRDSFSQDGEIMRTCLGLDSIDQKIFGVYLIKFLTYNDTSAGKRDSSFQGILNRINVYKTKAPYKETREKLVLAIKFDTKIASPANFKKDRIGFAKLGMSPAELDDFEKFIEKNASRKTTYRLLLKEFINSRYSDQNLVPPPPPSSK